MEQSNGTNVNSLVNDMAVYVIRDEKLKTCGPLFLAKDDEAAMTMVSRSLVLPDGKPSPLAVFADGYTLRCLGYFNTEVCEITPSGCTRVCDISDLVSGVVSNFKAVSRSASAFLEALDKKGED